MFKHGINRVLKRKVKLNKKLQFFSKYTEKTAYVCYYCFFSFSIFLFLLPCNIGADNNTKSAILNMKTAFVAAERSVCELLVKFCAEKHNFFL